MAGRVEKVAGETLVLDCEVSRSNAEVTWKKNGEEVEDSRNITILEDGVMRQLTVHSLTMEDAGQYVCDAKDDVMDFHVKVQGRLMYKALQKFRKMKFFNLLSLYVFMHTKDYLLP